MYHNSDKNVPKKRRVIGCTFIFSLLVLIPNPGCNTGGSGGIFSLNNDQRFIASLKSDGTTSVCNGDQKFNVPISRWRSKRDWLDFSLFYHSVTYPVRLKSTNKMIFADPASLSEKNSKWTHTYVSWIDLYPPEDDGSQKVFLNDPWQSMTFNRYFDSQKVVYKPSDSQYIAELTEKKEEFKYFDMPCKKSIMVSHVPASLTLQMPNGSVYTYDRIVFRKGECETVTQYYLTKITTARGNNIDIDLSQGNDPHVVDVKDSDGTMLTFRYKNKLLTSVTDPKNNVHTFTYSPVPDENKIRRQKLSGIHIAGSPSKKIYSWKFSYRNSTHSEADYGGSYTGDLVVYKKDISGKESKYTYFPVDLVGKPPHIVRPTIEDWHGHISHISWNEGDDGRLINKEVWRTKLPSGQVSIQGNDRAPDIKDCQDH